MKLRGAPRGYSSRSHRAVHEDALSCLREAEARIRATPNIMRVLAAVLAACSSLSGDRWAAMAEVANQLNLRQESGRDISEDEAARILAFVEQEGK